MNVTRLFVAVMIVIMTACGGQPGSASSGNENDSSVGGNDDSNELVTSGGSASGDAQSVSGLTAKGSAGLVSESNAPESGGSTAVSSSEEERGGLIQVDAGAGGANETGGSPTVIAAGGSSSTGGTIANLGGMTSTGGASSVGLTGGTNFAGLATGGASPLSLTGGASSASSASGTNPVGLTGGKSSTGGTTSSSVIAAPTAGSGTVVMMAGTSSVGSTIATACSPKLNIEFVSHSTEVVLPGTNDLSVLTFKLKAECQNIEIKRSAFHIVAADYDATDASPFRHRAIENFVDVKLVNVNTGAVISGPAVPQMMLSDGSETMMSDEPAHVGYTDSFILPADVTQTVAVKLDVSSNFSASRADVRYSVVFNRVEIGNGAIPIAISYANGFDVSRWPSFTVSNPNLASHFVATYSSDSPKARIVVPSKSSSYEIVAQYIVTNDGVTLGQIGSVVISQTNANGKLSDCDVILAYVDGVLCSSIEPIPGKRFDVQSIDAQLSSPSCNKWVQKNESVALEVRCIVAQPIAPSLAQEDDPKSGDTFSLKVMSISSKDGKSGFVKKHEVPSLVLRKAKPIITTSPLSSNVLSNGNVDLIRFKMASSDVEESIAVKGVRIKIEKMGNAILRNFRLRKESADLDSVECWVSGVSCGSGGYIREGTVTGNVTPIFDTEEILSNDGSVYTLHADVTGVDSGSIVMASFATIDGHELAVTGTVDTSSPGYLTVSGSDSSWPVQSFVWSDMSDLMHNPQYVVGSADWTNGLYVSASVSDQLLSY